jgi:hypothetical protein
MKPPSPLKVPSTCRDRDDLQAVDRTIRGPIA